MLRDCRNAFFAASIAITAATSAALPQSPQQKPVGEFTLHDFAAKWMMQQDDIADIAHYAESNRLLQAKGLGRERIILFGDSITYHWPAEMLARPGFDLINRGIPGQNTSQMLLRFEADVVALSPSIVVILAGTNDIRAYFGDPKDLRESALEKIQRNITAMTDIAKARNIDVIICAVTPVGPAQADIFRDPATIVTLNAWLADFAKIHDFEYADYYSAVLGAGGLLNPDYSTDGLHVNSAGYEAMSTPLSAAIENSRKHKAPSR